MNGTWVLIAAFTLTECEKLTVFPVNYIYFHTVNACFWFIITENSTFPGT